jgi:hypothetical protein
MTESSSSSSSSSSSKSSKSSKTPLEEAQEHGVLGETRDELPNDAYTVTGQGPETAKAEREARDKLRAQERADSQEGD